MKVLGIYNWHTLEELAKPNEFEIAHINSLIEKYDVMIHHVKEGVVIFVNEKGKQFRQG